MAETLEHVADALPVILLRVGFGVLCACWLLAIYAFVRPLWSRQ